MIILLFGVYGENATHTKLLGSSESMAHQGEPEPVLKLTPELGLSGVAGEILLDVS